jgi:hypothetical protein
MFAPMEPRRFATDAGVGRLAGQDTLLDDVDILLPSKSIARLTSTASRSSGGAAVLADFLRCIIVWKLCTNMKADDVTDTLDLVLKASGLVSRPCQGTLVLLRSPARSRRWCHSDALSVHGPLAYTAQLIH